MEESGNKNVQSGFAYYLSERGLLQKQDALNALQQATKNQSSYINFLAKQKLVDETEIARAAADYFGFPLFDISAFNTELIPSEYLNIQLVKKRVALPLFKKSGLLFLAITDPTIENLYEVRFLTGFDIRFFIVEVSKLGILIDELLSSLILSEVSGIGEEKKTDNILLNAYKEDSHDIAGYDVESAPVINYVNKVLIDAIDQKASDIHFEHYEDTYRIRYRQQGILYAITSPPIKIASYLLARIKIISNLDITEHRIPQDGRFKLYLSGNHAVDFRVSVCPTLFGEKVVLRILDPTQVSQGLDKIGMDETQFQHFNGALQRSQGMILVTGPTGSGKTVTLYSALTVLNSVEKNISTVEDPVEIPMIGINQVHVNPKVGLTFATALRSFLRQDPDIIMVGEIRDLETAEIAVKASQTGHLVLSTLHTNSAPETVTRLMNMGIEPYNLATALVLVVAQRLVRVLCQFCKVREKFPEEVLLAEGFKKEEIASLELYGPGSCDQCKQGYKGRTGIFEVLPISEEMNYLIMQGKSTIEIAKLAKKEGVINLHESGLNKIKAGITSLAEVNRVFK